MRDVYWLPRGNSNRQARGDTGKGLMSPAHVSGRAAFPRGQAARKGLGGVVLPDGSVPKRSEGSVRPQASEGELTGGNSTPPGGA